MITTPEIIYDLFSFLDKDQIERIQLVNHFWNNVIIRRKNILPLREFALLRFYGKQIVLYATEKDLYECIEYKIKFDGTNLSKGNVSSRYSQLTVDEILTNLNDVVFGDLGLDNLLNMMKLVTTKTGSRFCGRFGRCDVDRYDSKLAEIFDNYIIVDILHILLGDIHIREAFVNPEIVQLPSTPKEIRLINLKVNENDEVLHFTCNGKLNGANRLTIQFNTSDINYENFIRQWFELYLTHQNPISLVGKFQIIYDVNSFLILHDVKTFLNNTQLRVQYSLEKKEFHNPYKHFTNQYLNRRCVLHETDSYALVIEMAYGDVTDMSSINASDLYQPSDNKLEWISFCVKSL